jgi:hypothetical protein
VCCPVVGPGAAAGVEVGARAVPGHRVPPSRRPEAGEGSGGDRQERENLAWFGPARVRVRNAYRPDGPGWDTASI